MDLDQYNTLTSRLESCDLRELQNTITGKTLCPNFSNRFVSIESFVVKFNQLAELRNGIRHSRGVDEITRKEAEAAWFEQVMKK